MLYYFLYEVVIVKCFDFVGVDNFFFKRIKFCFFQYCFFVIEDVIVNNVSKCSGVKFGFFKGKVVNISEIKMFDDNSFMWEVVQYIFLYFD